MPPSLCQRSVVRGKYCGGTLSVGPESISGDMYFDDAIGSFVENQLKHYGVDSRFLRKVNGDCRASLAIVESRVEDHQSVIYRNNAADFQMDQGDFVSIKMSEFSAMIITGTCLTSNPSRQAT